MGPWIVPKEFYGDPMKRLRQTLSVDGKVMQEAGAADMIHSIYELIEYASSIITLFPGDVDQQRHVGRHRHGARRTAAKSVFLKPGEKIVATIDGIGTLTLPVVAGAGTGARHGVAPAAGQHLSQVVARINTRTGAGAEPFRDSVSVASYFSGVTVESCIQPRSSFLYQRITMPVLRSSGVRRTWIHSLSRASTVSTVSRGTSTSTSVVVLGPMCTLA